MPGQVPRSGKNSDGRAGLQALPTRKISAEEAEAPRQQVPLITNPLEGRASGARPEPPPLLPASKRHAAKRIEETAEERFERDVTQALALRPSDEVLAARVAQLEKQITGLHTKLKEDESVVNYSIEIFIAVAAGVLTAPLGALAVGESPSKELLKAVVAGASGGMVVIVVFAAKKVVRQIWIDYRKSRGDGCGDVGGSRPGEGNHPGGAGAGTSG